MSELDAEQAAAGERAGQHVEAAPLAERALLYGQQLERLRRELDDADTALDFDAG